MAKKNIPFSITDYLYESTVRKQYTREEIIKVIESNSLTSLQSLSQAYFYRDGLYKRILIYYATLLKYVGILIPNPNGNNKLSTPSITKRYNAALNYINKINLADLFIQISLKVLINGSYYGIFSSLNKKEFSVFDLPTTYCRSLYKDLYGNDIIEFNVCYFDTIVDETSRKQTLKVYPKIISDGYYKYKRKQLKSSWIKIPTDIGFYFSFFDDARPLFADTILATVDYDEGKELDKKRDLEEIKKIIVQKMPHLTDGTLVFEPPEAEVMHEGAVQMLSGSPNISVLTSYADVDAIVSHTNDATNNILDKKIQNVYSTAGVSGQLFSPTGTQALGTSITNDMTLMMILANKYGIFISRILNSLFANSQIDFKYEFLPVSHYNVTQYITDSLKLASNGFSFLLPSIALGLNQKDLVNIKQLENDVLKLTNVLLPLNSSYTSTGEPGRPEKPIEEKSEKTLQNEESLNNQ